MRPVYMVSGGITKFSKASPDKDFRYMVREAFDYARRDVPGLTMDRIDGSVCGYFSDHFTRQLKAGAMVQDYLGLCPKPSVRVEGGGPRGAVFSDGLGGGGLGQNGRGGGLRLRNHVQGQHMEGQ